jgi:hypothetical protein
MEPFQRQHLNPETFPATVRAKWPDSLLIEGFVPFPKKLLRVMPRLLTAQHGVEDLALILSLVDYKRRNLSRNPTVAYIGYVAGLAEDTARAGLERLKKRKWIQVDAPDSEGGIKFRLEGFTKVVESLAEEGQ